MTDPVSYYGHRNAPTDPAALPAWAADKAIRAGAWHAHLDHLAEALAARREELGE